MSTKEISYALLKGLSMAFDCLGRVTHNKEKLIQLWFSSVASSTWLLMKQKKKERLKIENCSSTSFHIGTSIIQYFFSRSSFITSDSTKDCKKSLRYWDFDLMRLWKKYSKCTKRHIYKVSLYAFLYLINIC